MAEIKWTVNNIIRFLNIYQKYDCLWDASSAEYLKSDIREVAFRNMMEDLNNAGLQVTAEPLKKKIKSIRDTYRNEVNRIKKSKGSGAGLHDIYKPKLGWFSTADSFLHFVFHGRESISNLDIDTRSSCSQDVNTVEEEDSSEIQPSTYLSRQKAVQVMSSSQLSEFEGENMSPKRMAPPSLSKMPKPGKRKNCPSNFESAVNKLHDIAHLTTNDVEDQYDKFGKHIAAQLCELPLRSFIILQEKMQSLISAERLSWMEPETPRSSILASSLHGNDFNLRNVQMSQRESSSDFTSDNDSQQEQLSQQLYRNNGDFNSNTQEQEQGLDMLQRALLFSL